MTTAIYRRNGEVLSAKEFRGDIPSSPDFWKGWAKTDSRRARLSGYPMYCDAAGINPNQISEMMELDRKLGVPTEYTPDGRAIFTDRLHRKKYCEAHKLYDRNNFGGGLDPQHGKST